MAHVAIPKAHTFPHVLPLFGSDFNIEPHTFSETTGAAETVGDSETATGVGGEIGNSTISVTSVVESDSDLQDGYSCE